jgi:hypothetical protein
MVTIAKGDIPVGLDLGAHSYTITPELVADYCAGTGSAHPWYDGPSAFGAPVAPALILHSEIYRFGGWYLPNVFGNLHARQEWELYAPAMVGDEVTTRSMIVDRYIKRGRDYVVNEAQVFGPDARLLMRGRTHQSFLLDTANEGYAVDKQREKSSERRFAVGEGGIAETLEPLERPVTIEMCKTFSPGVSYHNDVEAAKKLGFPEIVVQGMMPVCFLSEFMTERFGEGWYAGGRMDVRLVNVLWGSDGGVTCRGIVREYTASGSKHRAGCEIWAEKPDGTKIVVGQASALA